MLESTLVLILIKPGIQVSVMFFKEHYLNGSPGSDPWTPGRTHMRTGTVCPPGRTASPSPRGTARSSAPPETGPVRLRWRWRARLRFDRVRPRGASRAARWRRQPTGRSRGSGGRRSRTEPASVGSAWWWRRKRRKRRSPDQGGGDSINPNWTAETNSSQDYPDRTGSPSELQRDQIGWHLLSAVTMATEGPITSRRGGGVRTVP